MWKMQDTGTSFQENLSGEMSPFVGSKYESPVSSRSPSPSIGNHILAINSNKSISEDEISVGCPSPALHSSLQFKRSVDGSCTEYATPTCRCPPLDDQTDDYFKPLKKLKMVKIEPDRRTSPKEPEVEDKQDGVKSFSIEDILNHKPSKVQCSRIVRPWDTVPEIVAHQQRIEHFQRQLKVQHLALLRPAFVTLNASYTSETGSDRSSSVASDCCSPDILPNSSSRHQQRSQQAKQPGGPLDALFQMTSKTFDSTAGESSADGQDALNMFNNRQQPKKKRKSRTAFTNHQIFELEKRFLYQKYLSPADRDEIASSLGLTNAQVITWFQNRRAKLKRDMEELKKDVESAKLLTAHKSFLENVTDLGILKKKSTTNEDDCSKNLVN